MKEPATIIVAVPPAYIKPADLTEILSVSRTEVYRFLKAKGLATEEIYPGGPRRISYAKFLAATGQGEGATS